MRISENTQFCGSIARIPSTFGTTVYNMLYEKLGLDYIYYAFGTEDCEGAIRGMRALNFRFFALSMPHKETVIQYLDDVDVAVKEIGAVNSVLNTNGHLKGFNSDWIGVSKALKEETELVDKQTLVVGAGGAARAAVYAVKKENAKEIVIVNRTLERAKQLANDLGVEYRSIDDVDDFDAVVGVVGHHRAAPSLLSHCHRKDITPPRSPEVVFIWGMQAGSDWLSTALAEVPFIELTTAIFAVSSPTTELPSLIRNGRTSDSEGSAR